MTDAKRRGPIKRLVSVHAKSLRSSMTEAEQKIWFHLRDRRLAGFKFRRQVTIHPFIVDFLCVERKLIVEVDGSQHNEEVDAARTAVLEQQGYRVIRFWNNDALARIEGVLTAILAALNNEG